MQYEKAIQTAFREASDQLAERQSLTNQLDSYNKILQASQESEKIYDKRRAQGLSSGLEVLDSKINLLTATQNQASTKKEYLANLITLYKVLGGGSELE